MQEEIEHKTVNFAISSTKLSARTLLRGMQFLLRQYDKHASQGKQSMKRLVRQNRGVTNVEIQKTGIKDFDRYAKRYHIDYTKSMWTSTLILHSIWRIAMNLLADKHKNTVDFDLKSTVFVTLI